MVDTVLIWLQFSALVRNEMVQSLSCYYEPKRRQFYSVIELGSEICGYKRIVHGEFRLPWRQQMQQHVVLGVPPCMLMHRHRSEVLDGCHCRRRLTLAMLVQVD